MKRLRRSNFVQLVYSFEGFDSAFVFIEIHRKKVQAETNNISSDDFTRNAHQIYHWIDTSIKNSFIYAILFSYLIVYLFRVLHDSLLPVEFSHELMISASSTRKFCIEKDKIFCDINTASIHIRNLIDIYLVCFSRYFLFQMLS